MLTRDKNRVSTQHVLLQEVNLPSVEYVLSVCFKQQATAVDAYINLSHIKQ